MLEGDAVKRLWSAFMRSRLRAAAEAAARGHFYLRARGRVANDLLPEAYLMPAEPKPLKASKLPDSGHPTRFATCDLLPSEGKRFIGQFPRGIWDRTCPPIDAATGLGKVGNRKGGPKADAVVRARGGAGGYALLAPLELSNRASASGGNPIR